MMAGDEESGLSSLTDDQRAYVRDRLGDWAENWSIREGPDGWGGWRFHWSSGTGPRRETLEQLVDYILEYETSLVR